MSKYGSEGFRVRLRRLSEYGSVACLVERPTRETRTEQYSDTVLRNIYFFSSGVAIPPAINRSAFWGIAESALASASGVLPRKCPESAPESARKTRSAPGSAPESAFPHSFPRKKHSWEHSQFSGHSRGALSGALSGKPQKALRKHSPEHFRRFPKKRSCKFRGSLRGV